MQGEVESIYELSCSICMCLFQTPITIECGHTFCRYCLLHSFTNKNSCPMCRKTLKFISQRQHEDETLNQIVSSFRKNQNKRQDSFIENYQQFLLLDIRSSSLLLPYTKIIGTFELQSENLLSKLDKFVARQEPPYNKFGVISKIKNITQLRYNIYECVIEGKCFCEIKKQEVEQVNEPLQDYFYRKCQVKIIRESYEIPYGVFSNFFVNFQKIKDAKMQQKIFRVVDAEYLFSKGNSLAVYYSIMRLINVKDNEKYQIVTSFDREKRQNFLRKFLEGYKVEEDRNFSKFIMVQSNGIIEKGSLWLLFFILTVLVLLCLFYDDGEMQL